MTPVVQSHRQLSKALMVPKPLCIDIAKVVELRRKGLTWVAVARHLGVSERQVPSFRRLARRKLEEFGSHAVVAPPPRRLTFDPTPAGLVSMPLRRAYKSVWASVRLAHRKTRPPICNICGETSLLSGQSPNKFNWLSLNKTSELSVV